MQPWPETCETLLARLHNVEDQIAWRDFVAIYEPLILRVAVQRGLQDADARDVTQTVLIAVAKAAGDWQTGNSRGAFRGWLARVTTNAAINLLQRGARYRGSGTTTILEQLDQAPAIDPELTALWLQQRRQQLFLCAAEKVRPSVASASWQCFWQVSVEGKSCQQVAQDLQLSLGAVYAARSRIMSQIRQQVAVLEKEDTG